jgi:hypothetical protein
MSDSSQPLTQQLIEASLKSDFWENICDDIKGVMARDVFPDIKSGVGVEIFFDVQRFSDGRTTTCKKIRTSWTIGGDRSSRAKCEASLAIELTNYN